jgi:protein-lysine N-methyltransferase EEF2KMT
MHGITTTYSDGWQTYDKVAISALVATLRFLFDLRPALTVVISGAVRNAETFETFRQACGTYLLPVWPVSLLMTFTARSKFDAVEVDFAAKPMREQTALFYATAVPLKILKITGEHP